MLASVSSETMTTLAALRTRFSLLLCLSCDLWWSGSCVRGVQSRCRDTHRSGSHHGLDDGYRYREAPEIRNVLRGTRSSGFSSGVPTCTSWFCN